MRIASSSFHGVLKNWLLPCVSTGAVFWPLWLHGIEILPASQTPCDELEFIVGRVFARDCQWSLEYIAEIKTEAPASVRLLLTARADLEDCRVKFTIVKFRGKLGRLPPGDYAVSAHWTDVLEGPFETTRIFVAETSCTIQAVRGDVNADGGVDITDPVGILGHLFLGTPIACLAAADTDSSGVVELTDAIYALDHLFLGGPAPGMPFPGCGTLPPGPGGELPCQRTGCPWIPAERPVWMFQPDGCFQCQPCTAPSLEMWLQSFDELGIEVLASGIQSEHVCAACGCPSGRGFRVLVSPGDTQVLERLGWRRRDNQI